MIAYAVDVLSRMSRAAAGACAVALLAGISSAALAQEDLPGRVGRVADMAGELFIAPQDKPDAWAPAALNYPVASGDNLWVGHDGRAEIDIGGTQVRLSGDSNVHVARLEDRQFALFVAQGRTSLRVRVLDGGEVARIDTPNAQITITRPGLYRIDVSPDREHTFAVVREGEMSIQTTSALQQVLPGQSASIDGATPQYATVQNGIGGDEFDAWVADRDRYYRASANGKFVSPQMVGAADLAQYGTWSQNQEVGSVWYPNDVPADWAPYRNGYWVDVGAWGPTWVDYAPWGYAPFHYGRWAFIGGRWGWAPGVYVARPMWAPALVAWTGGAGWGVSVGVGGPVYGWVPLAWGEPFRPWWGRCSYGCWDRFNRPYNVNMAVWRPNGPPPTSFRNWNAPNGVTAVHGSSFYARKPVQQNLVRVSRDQVASAPVLSSAPQVRNDASRASMQRPANAPPPASSFQSATARPSSPSSGNMMRGTLPAQPQNASVSPTARTPGQSSSSPSTMQRDDRRSSSYAQPASPSQSLAQPQGQTPSRGAQPQAAQQRGSQQYPQGQMTRSPQPTTVQPQMQSQQPTRVQAQPSVQAQPQRVQPPAQAQPQPQRVQPQAPMPQSSQSRSAPQPVPQASPQPAPQARPAHDAGGGAQRSTEPRPAEPQKRDTPQSQDSGSGGGNLQRQGR